MGRTDAKKSLQLIIGFLVAGHVLCNGCCDAVRFASTGLLAESEQDGLIGTYNAEYGHYRNWKNGKALYFYESRGVSIL